MKTGGFSSIVPLWRLVEATANLLFPPCCLVCRKPTALSKICHRCLPPTASLSVPRCEVCHAPHGSASSVQTCELCRLLPRTFRAFRFVYDYSELSRDLVHAMKYGPSLKLCRTAGAILAREGVPMFKRTDWDIMTAVPSSLHKLKERGFNQCAVLGREFCRIVEKDLGKRLSFDPLILAHRGKHPPQAMVKHADRMKNVRRVFQLRRPLRGERILLIDDVVTTGSTTAAASVVLLAGGAKSVDVLSLCRAQAFEEFRQAIASHFPPPPPEVLRSLGSGR